MSSLQKINTRFFFQKKVALTERKRLKSFISDFFLSKGKKNGELRIIFCSDEELLQINRDFLKHDYYTDIITFPFTGPISPVLEAEVYISVDRVRENAEHNNTSFIKELHRVIFHGCLHLSGLGDNTKGEQIIMRNAEDMMLNSYF